MHERTVTIMRNLGFDESILKPLIKEDSQLEISRKSLRALRRLGLPKSALDQIKFLESPEEKIDFSKLTHKELIATILRKCKRTFEAFALREIPARIVFESNEWNIFSETYNREIEKLHKVCKPYFDDCAVNELKVTFAFDGSPTWKIITDKESDLPESI